MSQDDSIKSISGVGDALAAKYIKSGIASVEDLINFLPRRYEDFSEIQKISSIKPGPVSVKAKITTVKGRYARRGLHITEALASDKSGSVRLVWFNQPYREAQIKKNSEYYISGKFELNYRRLSIMNPACELVSEFPVNAARIVPIYRESQGLKSNQIRRNLAKIIADIENYPELLPKWILDEHNLVSAGSARAEIHFPKTIKNLSEAKRRLAFEELFELSLAGLLNKHQLGNDKTVSIPFNEQLVKKFVKSLPYKLTDSQRAAAWQIFQDIEKTKPMNRLLQGDVGSGKTVVATMAAIMAVNNDMQVALMAPTEMLAYQHAKNISELLSPIKLDDVVGLLTGSMTKAQKSSAYKKIENGQMKLIIGTHSLIQEQIKINNLGLVIVDEQHRFGVEQRKELIAKASRPVHVLNMTATPIPRTLALTLYGELEFSTMREKPKNRKAVITRVIQRKAMQQVYRDIDREIESGKQVFVVTPLISESEKIDSKNAEKTYEELSKGPFAHRRVGLLHGKQNPKTKEKVMQDFVDKKLDMLISTTVIEVGVDVPNATVMVIEDADRFGLAQIHQLRGRVGRSEDQGYCYLVISGENPPSRRMRALETSSDGFALAELDLDIRGPGAIYGTLQHGVLDLRIAKITDRELIVEVRGSAEKFIALGENLIKYPELNTKVQKLRAITLLN